MKDALHHSSPLHKVLDKGLFFFMLALLVALHFEAVLVVPADFIREGASLKFFDLLMVFFVPSMFMLYMASGKLPLPYLLVVLVFLVLSLSVVASPSDAYTSMAFNGAWMFLSVSTAFFFVFVFIRWPKEKKHQFLHLYLTIMWFVYGLAFADFLLQFATKSSLVPEALDKRFHQVINVPLLGYRNRFEGFSTLSLGFVGLGVMNLVFSLYLKRRTAAIFHALLLFCSFSIGAFVAILMVLFIYFYKQINMRSRVFFSLPILGTGAGLMYYLYFIKINTAGGLKWSVIVRLEFYQAVVRVLFKDPLGLSFGQSRVLYDFWERYALNEFTTLYAKLHIQKIVVVESSHLELLYEFGWLGLGVFLLFSYLLFHYSKIALQNYYRPMLYFAGGAQFFWFHAFFNPAYYYQLKFWLFNVLALFMLQMLNEERKKKNSLKNPNTSVSPKH